MIIDILWDLPDIPWHIDCNGLTACPCGIFGYDHTLGMSYYVGDVGIYSQSFSHLVCGKLYI